MLVAMTLTDLERRIIPNKILAAASLIGLVVVVMADPGFAPRTCSRPPSGRAACSSSQRSRTRGMGLGDVKLTAVMGLFLGVWVIPALLIALLAGSLAGIGDHVEKGRFGAQGGDSLRAFSCLRGRLSDCWPARL